MCIREQLMNPNSQIFASPSRRPAGKNLPELTKKTLTVLLTMTLASLLFVSLSLGAVTKSVNIRSSGTIGVSPPPYVEGAISPLHVEGPLIKDSNGKTVVLRGVNKVQFADDPDGSWMGDTFWKEANVVAELDAMKGWGANVIRCHQAIDNWKNNLDQPYSALPHRTAIKEFLSLAAARGMYVVYDGFTVRNYYNGQTQDPLPYPPYQTSTGASTVIASEEDFVDWWVSVASELKGYNNVIFELWNEPYGDYSQTAKQSWFSVSQQCINAIRSTGATQLIVLQWNLGCAVNLNFPETPLESLYWINEANINDPLGNIVYSTHLYRDYGHIHYSTPTRYNVWELNDIDRGLSSMGYYDMASKYPLFIGEFGANVITTGTDLDHEYQFFDNALTLLNQHGISYVGFWWRTFGTYAMLNDITSANQAGEILKQHLLSPG